MWLANLALEPTRCFVRANLSPNRAAEPRSLGSSRGIETKDTDLHA